MRWQGHGMRLLWLRMANGWESTGRRPHLLLLSALSGSHDLRCPVLVRGVVKQCSNIMDKQGIQKFRDLLLVGEIQSSLIGNPVSVLAGCHTRLSQTAISTYQTPLRCMGPILTTCRIFSLFKIPSLRPLVMPATLSNLVPLIIWLSITLVCQHQTQTKQTPFRDRTYLHGVRRKYHEPRLESTGFLRLPTR
jgi:hypothetical protein